MYQHKFFVSLAANCCIKGMKRNYEVLLNLSLIHNTSQQTSQQKKSPAKQIAGD
jgi:hypothetical protein